MKNTVLFCAGPSGSGKSYFIKNVLPASMFHNLKSATTRQMRDGEQDGREYYFRDEQYFENEKFATTLWVNEQFWHPGVPKWMYGVPEFEIFDNLGQNFTYDVIEPKYVRQMIDWFYSKNLNTQYDFKILFFMPHPNSMETITKRQNMPDDLKVRRANTCTTVDFRNAGLFPDHRIISRPTKRFIDRELLEWLNRLR